MNRQDVVIARAQARVGASPQLVSADELDVQSRRIDAAIDSLDADVKAQFSYIDPASLETTAAAAEGIPGGSELKDEVAKLRAEAKVLRERDKTKTAAKLAQERAFGTRWIAFVKEWQTWFNTDLSSALKLNAGLVQAWDKLEAYSLRYQKMRSDFSALSGKPSLSEEPTPNKAVEDKSSGLAGIGTTISNTIFWLGVGVTVYFGFVYVIPLFFGAAGATKLARRQYREI